MTRKKTIECPQCSGPSVIEPSNIYRPFCSRRCKLIDLGDWLDESNRIPGRNSTASSAPWAQPDDDAGMPH